MKKTLYSLICNSLFNLSRNISYDEETLAIIDDIFTLSKCIYSKSDNNYRRIWLKLHTEKKKYWFLFESVEENEYRTIFLNDKQIYKNYDLNKGSFKWNATELFTWIKEALTEAIIDLKNGSYNKDVNENLYFRNRIGFIRRDDYYRLYPEEKKDYTDIFTNKEIKEFLNNIKDQKDNYPIGEYKQDMTANDFYHYCSLGYKACRLKNVDNLTEKEQYYEYADGRDDGLKDIDGNSNIEFDKWLNTQGLGHRFDVCRNGVRLCVDKSKKGYYLTLSGEYYEASQYAVKFYNALRKEGIAIHFYESEIIIERFTDKGLIGIVPQYHYWLRFCENMFPKKLDIKDFIHIPEGREYRKMLPYTNWIKEGEVLMDFNYSYGKKREKLEKLIENDKCTPDNLIKLIEEKNA